MSIAPKVELKHLPLARIFDANLCQNLISSLLTFESTGYYRRFFLIINFIVLFLKQARVWFFESGVHNRRFITASWVVMDSKIGARAPPLNLHMLCFSPSSYIEKTSLYCMAGKICNA